MALKMAPLTRLPKGGDRFLWDWFVPEPELRYASILKFDPSQPRDPKGTPTGGRFARDARSPIDQKRRDFRAFLKRGEHIGKHLETIRVEMIDAWKVWDADTKNRKKPLKPDGAAAKKLETYKKAKALEDAFHLKHDEVTKKVYEWNAKARELLKVSPEMRSKVKFREATNPELQLHPALVSASKKYLETFRQFDGSGAFSPLTFPADKVEEFKKVFGTIELDKNPDGTYSVAEKINLSKAISGRAHADMFGVHLSGGRELDRQVYHEVAHLIEMKQGAVLKAALAFRESRAVSPREVYKLNTIKPSLGDDEVAVRGNFEDVYTAKVYPHDVATEVVSTGVESYIMDPIRFSIDSPEHFNLIFDIMQGKYRHD